MTPDYIIINVLIGIVAIVVVNSVLKFFSLIDVILSHSYTELKKQTKPLLWIYVRKVTSICIFVYSLGYVTSAIGYVIITLFTMDASTIDNDIVDEAIYASLFASDSIFSYFDFIFAVLFIFISFLIYPNNGWSIIDREYFSRVNNKPNVDNKNND